MPEAQLLSDSQEDTTSTTLKEDETDLLVENQRLRTLVKRYRNRLEGVRKAMNTDENDDDTEQTKLNEVIANTLTTQLRLWQEQQKNSNPIAPPTTVVYKVADQSNETELSNKAIAILKEEVQKLIKENNIQKSEKEQLNHTLITERKDLYKLKEECQYLKKVIIAAENESAVWKDERNQYITIRDKLEYELAKEKQESEIFIKTFRRSNPG